MFMYYFVYSSDSPIDFVALKIYIHSGYDQLNWDKHNDIAVIKLDKTGKYIYFYY